MRNIYDYTLDELAREFAPSYRAKQIYGWLYHRYIDDFDAMHNVSKELRAALKESFTTQCVRILKVEHSADGSKKYLFGTQDGHSYEAVLLQMREEQSGEGGEKASEARYTICLSSQIGCRVG